MKNIIISVITILSIISMFAGCGENNMDNAGSKIESSVNSGMDKIESGINSATDNTSNHNTSSDNTNSNSAKITQQKAKEIALKHAGLSESDISDLEIEIEKDKDVLRYEISFDTKSTEYDYHINADTGDIISSSKENRD